MSKKLLALDLDGTAVDDNGKLGERSKRALLSARRQGHILCFVTGRRDIDMLPLGQDTHFVDYLILNNGGKIVTTADGHVIKNDLIAKKDAKMLISYCLQNGYLLHVVSGSYWAVNKMTPGTQSYVLELGVSPEFYRSLEDVPYDRVEGFMATSNGKEVGAYIDRAGLDLDYVASEPSCIDIMKNGVTKWNGIKALANCLAFPVSQTVAVGNYSNDIDMLTHAGIGIAVQNALPDVKNAADYVTRSDNNHDAVAEVVEKFILLPP